MLPPPLDHNFSRNDAGLSVKGAAHTSLGLMNKGKIESSHHEHRRFKSTFDGK